MALSQLEGRGVWKKKIVIRLCNGGWDDFIVMQVHRIRLNRLPVGNPTKILENTSITNPILSHYVNINKIFVVIKQSKKNKGKVPL